MNKNIIPHEAIVERLELYQKCLLGPFDVANPFTSGRVANPRYSEVKLDTELLHASYDCEFTLPEGSKPIHTIDISLQEQIAFTFPYVFFDEKHNFTEDLDDFINMYGLGIARRLSSSVAEYAVNYIMNDPSIGTINAKDADEWLCSAKALFEIRRTKKPDHLIAHPRFINKLMRNFRMDCNNLDRSIAAPFEVYQSKRLNINACLSMPEDTGFLFTHESLLIPMPPTPIRSPYPCANGSCEYNRTSISLTYYDEKYIMAELLFGVGYVPGSLTKMVL